MSSRISQWSGVALLALSLTTIAPLATSAQTPAATPPPAKTEDVSSIDAVMKSVYDVISGPAGEKRNWDRMRSLFVPGARLIPTGTREGKAYNRVMTLEEYIASSGPYLEKNGFFEVEVSRKLERYGNIVHLFSTYESRNKKEDAKPFARGINSFQLWFDGTRWYVVTIYWQAESKEVPIPSKYLTKE